MRMSFSSNNVICKEAHSNKDKHLLLVIWFFSWVMLWIFFCILVFRSERSALSYNVALCCSGGYIHLEMCWLVQTSYTFWILPINYVDGSPWPTATFTHIDIYYGYSIYRIYIIFRVVFKQMQYSKKHTITYGHDFLTWKHLVISCRH